MDEGVKLYLISQTEQTSWDTYDSAVVCAVDEKAAACIHPSGGRDWQGRFDWCKSPEAVTVRFIGEAAPGIQPGIVLASYNAG